MNFWPSPNIERKELNVAEAGVGHTAGENGAPGAAAERSFPHENLCACPGWFFWFILWEVQFPKRG